jgi:hypothetical protein
MADLVGQNPGEDRDASLIAGLPDLLDQDRRADKRSAIRQID